MQKTTKISLGAIFAAAVLVTLAFTSSYAFADGSSGHFDPQTQFPVGTTVTFRSVNGVAAQRDSFTRPRFTQYDASAVIVVKVEDLTRDGGVRWAVLSGTLTINGQIYTITSGDGHINAFDEVASGMIGDATGPSGATYRWGFHGLATLHNSVVLVGLRGGIATMESDHALLGYHLIFIATMTPS